LSKYSTELRFIIESGFDLGLKDYPLFDENYRQQLNNKIINHYYFDEIGFETVARFKHYLNNTMNEIMPYYNQLLESELITINPLLSFEKNTDANKNITNTSDKIQDNTTDQNINNSTSLQNKTNSKTDEIQNRVTDENQTTNINSSKNVDGNNTSNELNVFYDTPNGSLGDIKNSEYATTVTNIDKTNTIDENENLNSDENIGRDENISTTIDSNTLNTTDTGTTSNTLNTTNVNTTESNINESNELNIITENGFQIPLSDLLKRYRETFLNIDSMIIADLKDLFMMVY